MSITRLASAACVCAILLTGCSAPKKVPYLVDAETIPRESLAAVSTVKDPIFVQGDLLNICIYASDPTAVAQFNKGQYLTPEGAISKTSNNTNTAGTNTTSLTDYYLVDAEGNIDYPVIGRIHIAGKTKEQLAREIKDAIYPRYIKIEPTIDIRLMNFRVTILGQVKSPGVYQSDNERMNILEALAKAGDLDIRGDRENVLLYRTAPARFIASTFTTRVCCCRHISTFSKTTSYTLRPIVRLRQAPGRCTKDGPQPYLLYPA